MPFSVISDTHVPSTYRPTLSAPSHRARNHATHCTAGCVPRSLGTNRAPLRPFDSDAPQELVDKSAEVFRRVDPDLGEDYSTMKMGRNLDLETRKGKRAGGFQSSLQESRQPFIYLHYTTDRVFCQKLKAVLPDFFCLCILL